jgi:hypothetical protein
MVSPLPIEYPAAPHRLTARGNAHQPIFKGDQHRHSLLIDLMAPSGVWITSSGCLIPTITAIGIVTG